MSKYGPEETPYLDTFRTEKRFSALIKNADVGGS